MGGKQRDKNKATKKTLQSAGKTLKSKVFEVGRNLILNTSILYHIDWQKSTQKREKTLDLQGIFKLLWGLYEVLTFLRKCMVNIFIHTKGNVAHTG